MEGADFSGYATKNDLKCADGLTIRAGAFAHNNGKKVPLVWSHQHDGVENILGHAYLEARDDGVYTHAFFNDTESGKMAKQMVQHGDIDSLSIYANKLRKNGPDRTDVVHGEIHEVSLVMAGANPGALIDSFSIRHSDGTDFGDDEGVITTDDDTTIDLPSAGDSSDDTSNTDSSSDTNQEDLSHADSSTDNGGTTVADAATDTASESIADIYDSFSDDEKEVIAVLIAEAVAEATDGGDSAAQSATDTDTDEDALAHAGFQGYQEGFTHAMNVFDRTKNDKGEGETLSHSQLKEYAQKSFSEADTRNGRLSDSVLAHANDYGITDIEFLFPDAKVVGDMPELIARQADWVPKVLDATKRTPFSKIKTIVADITAPEARAKGYVKGTEKTEEVVSLLKRTTGPVTIYKKQKLDRDDIIDITDFDVVVWLKWEIRFMLNEELARAILIGDGRSAASPDKIKDPGASIDGVGIRSILNDHEMYSHKIELAANVDPTDTIKQIVRSRTAYRGSGNPTLYTTDDVLIDMLLLEDKVGRRLYETEAALAATLRVKEIVTVEVMNELPNVMAIIVNLVDYNIGTNRGGELTFFEDFDIDFNQNKYLLETRLSGALTKPKSAIVITRDEGTLATATQPTFTPATNTIAIPNATGVNYLIDDEVVTGNKVITEDTTVTAEPKSGYYLASNTTKSWNYTHSE